VERVLAALASLAEQLEQASLPVPELFPAGSPALPLLEQRSATQALRAELC
jgi:hypothetical protein